MFEEILITDQPKSFGENQLGSSRKPSTMDKELQNNVMIPSEHSPLLRKRRGSKFAQQGVDSVRKESEPISICHGDYTLVLIALCG